MHQHDARCACNVQLASVSEPQTTYTFTPTPGVVHYVAIRAINSVGAGSYSTETSFSIPSFIQPVNQSSPLGVAITPLNMSVTDPDGSARNFTHTGLPTGLALNATTGQIHRHSVCRGQLQRNHLRDRLARHRVSFVRLDDHGARC